MSGILKEAAFLRAAFFSFYGPSVNRGPIRFASPSSVLSNFLDESVWSYHRDLSYAQ
jgi:hypothetical protein